MKEVKKAKNNYTDFDPQYGYPITVIDGNIDNTLITDLPDIDIAVVYHFLTYFRNYLKGPSRKNWSSVLYTELFNQILGINITHNQFKSVMYMLKYIKKSNVHDAIWYFDISEKAIFDAIRLYLECENKYHYSDLWKDRIKESRVVGISSGLRGQHWLKFQDNAKFDFTDVEQAAYHYLRQFITLCSQNKDVNNIQSIGKTLDRIVAEDSYRYVIREEYPLAMYAL